MQGTGEQLYRCIGADDTGCLGNRSSLPVALNCSARQWTIISAGWKKDQYLPAGVGLLIRVIARKDCLSLFESSIVLEAKQALKFVKRIGQRCASAESTH